MVKMVDAVVVGGGIAGSTVAESLSRMGYKVLVLESGPKGRDKPCGGGTSSGCVKKFPYIKESIIHRTTELTHIYKDLKSTSKLDIYMVSRKEFDRTLQERAESEGADILYNTRARTINPNQKYVEADGKKIHYDILIGADGAASIVRRAMGFNSKSMPVIYGKAKSKLSASPESLIVSYEELLGYAWIFPKGTYVNIGIGGLMPGEYLNTKFMEFTKEYNLDVFYKHGWIIPYGNMFGAHYDVERGVYLCGDAAGFINSVTGEGIYYAMESGYELAQIFNGELDIRQYPTFYAKLMKIWDMFNNLESKFKEDANQSIIDTFKDEKAKGELMEYLFSDTDKKIELNYSDEDKVKMYTKILENLEE